MRRQRLFRDSSGAVAAEMAMILPGIAFVLLNVVDLSMYIWTKMQVDLAAHEAVGFVRATCGDDDDELPATYPADNCNPDLSGDMTDAAQTAIAGVTLGTPTEGWYCVNAEGDLQETGTLAAPPADCNGVVAGDVTKPGNYISVTASYAFSPIFPGASVVAILPATITRTSWMRLQ